MKNYKKPQLFTNEEIKSESLSMDSGVPATSIGASVLTLACHKPLGGTPFEYNVISPICLGCENGVRTGLFSGYCNYSKQN